MQFNKNMINNNQNVMDNSAITKLLIDEKIEFLHTKINQSNQNNRTMLSNERMKDFFMLQELERNNFAEYGDDPKTYTNTLLDEPIKLINNWNYSYNQILYKAFTKAWNNVLNYLQHSNKQEKLYDKVLDLTKYFLPKYHICKKEKNEQ